MKRFSPILLTLVLLCSSLSGCESSGGDEIYNNDSENTDETGDRNGTGNTDETDNTDMTVSTDDPAEVDFSRTDADMFTKRDLKTDYDESGSILIRLNGATASASSDSVRISGSTITITEDATYIISGTLDDGMIIVNAPDTAKLQLVLNGVHINCETSAPLYILEADKVFLTLADGTENTLSNGGAFTAIDENKIDAALFSKQDLTINGSGSLTVTSPAGHGIVSKDDLVITGGNYTITSASHGLDANDSVRIANASITVNAGKDGIHAENTDNASLGFVYISSGMVKIEAEGDGISAGAYVQVENGTIDVLAGGGSENGTKSSSDFYGSFKGGGRHGEFSSATAAADNSGTSMKGLKAANSILISDGVITINSADDGIHSNTSVTVNGGIFEIASGDDGIHADESLTVTAGAINITESYEGLEALHIDIQGGDIQLVATDDGINAAGGTDFSGMTGGRDGMFSGHGDMMGGGKFSFSDEGLEALHMDIQGGDRKPIGDGADFGDRDGFGGMGGGMSSSDGSIVISGGTIYIKMGGDGIDANGSVSITGGTITVSGANSGDTSILDFDSTGTISGGTFIGTGASGMAQNFSSSSTQGAIMVTTGTQSAGTVITLSDPDGNALVTHTADRDFSCVIISHASIVTGGTYTLTVGASTTAITMSGAVYGSGNSGGNMGGNRGGRW